ncbi:MAG: dicarboxylate/amino acid:cation symporter [Candidatus Latescibacteria bacterium]|nr:dicarboxylate/amino acid:cation symporter [Candidatus Latescibacterota bacterium]
MTEANNNTHKTLSIPVYPILIAVVAGGLIGHYIPDFAVKTKIFGEIFLSLLFVLVIPLIMSSMICGVTSLGDIRHLEKLGLKTVIYYLSSTLVAVLTGLLLVNFISPGKNAQITQTEFPKMNYSIVQTPISGGSILKLSAKTNLSSSDINPKRNTVYLIDQNLIGIIDDFGTISSEAIPITQWLNISGMKAEPKLSGTGLSIKTIDKKLSVTEVIKTYVPRNIFRSMINENIFPLILFSLIFGTVLTTIGEKGKPLIVVIEAVNITIIKCVILLMFLAPIGIFGLIAGSIGDAELTNPNGFLAEMTRLARYSATVIIGLIIHGAITLVLALKFIGKRDPIPFIRNMIPQLFTAFSTGSSMATLPVSMTLITEKNKVSEKVADFVLPLGATINMDGTALYQVVAAMFIAQIYNIYLGITEQIIIILTATIGSIGAAAIPQAGLVTLVMVLKSVGLPVEGIGMILSIDWFIDRCRTTVNSWGDVVGATIIDYFEGK